MSTENPTPETCTCLNCGAAIEAAAKACWQEMSVSTRFPVRTITKHMRALVATITNSQQKGGDQQCATLLMTNAPAAQTGQTNTAHTTGALESVASNAAPTSNPEGAATPAEDAKRLADRIVKHVENGIVYEVGASHVSIVRDVFEKWICEAIEHHAIQQATWHCETLAKLEATTPPSVTHAGMTLAHEIALALYPKRDDERQYPMFLAYRERAERTIASVLSRWMNPSVTEAARDLVAEIFKDDRNKGSKVRAEVQAESILTRIRERELREALNESDHYKAVWEKVGVEYQSALLEIRKLTDQIDLNRDEFLRIAASLQSYSLECDEALRQEIIGISDRSQQVIAQRVPVIEQRNKAEAECTRLRAQLEAAESEADSTLRGRMEYLAEMGFPYGCTWDEAIAACKELRSHPSL